MKKNLQWQWQKKPLNGVRRMSQKNACRCVTGNFYFKPNWWQRGHPASNHQHQPFPPSSNKLIIPLLMFLWVMALRFSYSLLFFFFFFPPQTVLHHNCTAWYFGFSLFSTVGMKQDWLLWIEKCLERPLWRVYGSSENAFFFFFPPTV